MAQQTIGIGSVANDGTGDDLRTAGDKINDNFTELYQRPYLLGASAVLASHTGDTNETTLATIALPAGALGANGIAEIESLWSFTANANVKTARHKLDGSTLTTAAVSGGSVSGIIAETTLQNRNAANSQIANSVHTLSQTAALTTLAKDTTGALNITLTAQLANAGDTITLERYSVRVTYKA